MDSVIVVPCFNEAERLDCEAILGYVRRHDGIRFLFVDDGSTDSTRRVLEELTSESDQLAMLALESNGGKCEAVRLGMLRAFEEGAEAVGYWDADLATPLDEIERFRQVLGADSELDVVLGSRILILGADIERRPLRHYFGRVAATAASMTLRLPVYDTQCGAKLFRATEEIRALFAEPFCSGWCFDVEILARLLKARREAGEADPSRGLVELPLKTWRDVAGSKVRPLDFVRAFVQLLRIRRRY